jgi:hypothetical protein
MSGDKYRVEVRLLGSKSGRMTLKVKTLHEGEDRDAAEQAFSDTNTRHAGGPEART